MKHPFLRRVLLACGLLGVTLGATVVTTSTARAATFCQGTGVPAGQIVVARYLDPGCANPLGTLRNAYRTDTAGVGQVACAPTNSFPFPAGYVAVERLNTGACSSGASGELRNAYRIDAPGVGKIVCAPTDAFPFPAGYVAVERLNTGACSSGASGELRNAYRIDTPAPGKVACAPTNAFPIPTGYTYGPADRLLAPQCSSGASGEILNAYRLVAAG